MQDQWSPLVGGEVTRFDRRVRLFLFLAWLCLVGWFLSSHVFWRDEVRAFSFALSGSNIAEMLKTTHGEGHPALWYLILRGLHDLFPYREVLPIAGAVIGIAAMALVAWRAPFRLAVIGLILFSFYGAFEYVAIARNYGLAVLTMFGIAALYSRIKGTLWLGVLVAILCNTNVPSCLLAAMFLVFRFVEMLTDGSRPQTRDWLVLAGNALLGLIGAYLCFRMIYPTFNDAAVSSNAANLGPGVVFAALIDHKEGFRNLDFGPFLLFIACLGLIRRPAAFCAALGGLIGLKLFFYFIYPSNYRHEALYVAFLITLYWMTSEGAGGALGGPRWIGTLQRIGCLTFLGLLFMQTLMLREPVEMQLAGLPYGRAKDVAKILKQPALRHAIVMADPDVMLETLPYYADNPLYFMRQQRFGKVAQLSRNARRLLTLDDVLADADRLHRTTGRPIVFMSHLSLPPAGAGTRRVNMMYHDDTLLDPSSASRFLSSTRLVARLRGAGTDEDYDLYVYPG